MFLDLGYSPIADAYVSSPNEESETHPLQLAFCTGCHLVQLLEVVDHETLFGTGYSFYSSASPPLSQYHATYADQVVSGHYSTQPTLAVEIGCNDGDFLQHLDAAGFRTLGVDPAAGPVSVARRRGLNVIERPFGYELAQEIRDDNGAADIVIANHVLAHVESVSDVLHGVSHLLSDRGHAYVEVQYLPDLLVNNAFDLIYHEHRNFFSLTSLESAVERWGLKIADASLTDRQGGSLRVLLARSSLFSSERESIRASETWLRDQCAYRGFQGRVDRIRNRLVDLLYASSQPIIGYGAPAKATTLLNFCQLDNDLILEVIDTTPAKQGRFIPGTGIPIVAPDDSVLTRNDTVLLLAWNYASQIIRNHASLTTSSGRWVVPIPTPTVL
jgi:novobiocin biosynthesis protein NovU/D-mycarose 3-C-methyltransferase